MIEGIAKTEIRKAHRKGNIRAGMLFNGLVYNGFQA
jgi:hypothetical protein